MSGLLYVKLDASYDDDDKIIRAGEKAELLYIRGLCLAKRILSDGFVSDAHLPRFGLSGVQARAGKLVEVGLWERDDDAGGYWIIAWLKHNRSAAEVDEIREKRREAGRRGGEASGKQRPKQNAKQSAEANAKHVGNPEEVGIGGRHKEEDEELLAPPSGDAPKPRKPRKPDLLFEALVDACGLNVDELTKSARGAVNKACAELREVGASPDGVRARAAVHRQRWPSAELTPSSLAKNYAQLGVSRVSDELALVAEVDANRDNPDWWLGGAA